MSYSPDPDSNIIHKVKVLLYLSDYGLHYLQLNIQQLNIQQCKICKSMKVLITVNYYFSQTPKQVYR